MKDAPPRAAGTPGVPGYSVGGGTLSEWRAAFPDAQLLKGGWSLGSGAVGDGVIEQITYGSKTFTFTGKNRAPAAAAPVTVQRPSQAPLSQ